MNSTVWVRYGVKSTNSFVIRLFKVFILIYFKCMSERQTKYFKYRNENKFKAEAKT